MKKILLATTIMATTAFAANAASTAFNGAYLGAQAGFVKSTTKTSAKTTIGTTYASKKSSGSIFGLYTGYGQNFNGFYFGGEASLLGDFTKRKVSETADVEQNVASILYTGTVAVRGTETVRYKRGIILGLAPRFGAVFGDNLIYIKPGIEISRDKATTVTSGTVTGNGIDGAGNPKSINENVNTSVSKSKTNVVFTPAFGYERAMGKVLFRAEYTYNPGGKITSDGDKISYKDHRFAIGAAYKF